ncbi:MAG: flagellar hook protein FlgE [Planctomycetota bacterium]|nr:flagellar hook protein FlgE [Planctomycetota bacterium]
MALRSLLTGTAGLRSHQQMLDVVANNLANINTTAFKSQRVRFADQMWDQIRSASGPSGVLGGSNPQQVGLGVRISAIDTDFQAGVQELTGNPLDMTIQDDGFFVMSDGIRNFYTRAGAFSLDEAGYLVDTGTGFHVQRLGAVGEGDPAQGFPPIQAANNANIKIPYGTQIPGNVTDRITLIGNLNALSQVSVLQPDGSYSPTVSTAIDVYDSLGTSHLVTLTFRKTAMNTWDMNASIDPTRATMSDGTVTGIHFNNDGSFDSVSADNTITLTNFVKGAKDMTIDFDLGTANLYSNLTQFGGFESVAASAQNGAAPGSLINVDIERDGTITGLFSNGKRAPVAQIALAVFANNQGLNGEGNNYYSVSPNSGIPLIGAPRTGGRGAILNGTLEASNVDVGLEFTRLLTAERGFQVNSRTIRVSDEVMQEAVNLIR